MLTVSLLLGLLALFVLRPQFAASAESKPHAFSVHDMLAMERISDVNVAPDGTRIVFTVRTTDLEKNKGRTDVWLATADGSGLRKLTTHSAGSSQPRWSPDGQTVYFLSRRGDSSQVWRIRVDGGEAQAVTNVPLDVGSFVVAPDGEHLALSLDVFPDAHTLTETKQRLDTEAERKSSGRVYEQLFVRHWDEWKDGRRAHVFVIALPNEGDAPASDAVDLMQGLQADCPSKPFGGAEEYVFTPDSREVVFALRNVGREEAWSTRFDLHAAPIDGSAPGRVVVDNGGAALFDAVFSPDGKTLAYLAMDRPGYEADRRRIMLKPWPDGDVRVLTSEWDRSPAKIVWSRDSRTIYTCANHLGQNPLFAITVPNGDERVVVPDGKVTEIGVAGDRLIYGLCHFKSPVELYSINPDGGESRALTHFNAERVAAVKMGDAEQFTFKGWNDDTVHAYVVKPLDFDPGRQYPVAFLIHGGPQGSFGNDFHYRWNPQTYAGAGYAVIMIDFHGSTGYGQAFTDAINEHWGDRPLEDLQRGLNAALERYDWMDRARVAALGASYGGYMINWIHGVWNEPFKCFVCHDGNIDERMAYYDTEELWFPEWERGGPPWEKPKAYAAHNPIDHVGKWSVPTLVIHSQNDFRVVDTQGISTFTALQRRGVPSKLLYFPDENHWVLKPHNSIQWHDEVIGWLDRWCKA